MFEVLYFLTIENAHVIGFRHFIEQFALFWNVYKIQTLKE